MVFDGDPAHGPPKGREQNLADERRLQEMIENPPSPNDIQGAGLVRCSSHDPELEPGAPCVTDGR